ncbi:hypothetical protein LSAT2_027137 [Lamellibrachia satsuma]|nr:hypothetical protein LSAT2_027137 [Lamellibrachia satsuma]
MVYGKRKSKEFYGCGKASKRRQLKFASQAAREMRKKQHSAASTVGEDVAVSSSGQVAQPSTSRFSATEKKFGYRRLIDEASNLARDRAGTDSDQPSTIIVRTCMLSGLVKNLLCPSCKCSTLEVRAVSRRLGLVCRLETFCSACDVIVNSVSTSDRLDKEKASNVAFIVT